MTKKQTEKLQKKIDDFNKKYPVGSYVNVLTDGGQTISTTVKHEATILGGHTAVGWFNGISGCYDLKRIKLNIES